MFANRFTLRLTVQVLFMSLFVAGLQAQDTTIDLRPDLIFPVVLTSDPAQDRRLASTLLLMNLSATPSVVAIWAFSGGRQDAIIDDDPAPTAHRTITLSPNESVQLPVRFRSPAGHSLRESWLAIVVREGAVSSGLRLIDFDTRRLDFPGPASDIVVDGVARSRVSRQFATWVGNGGCFPHTQSAYALVNPSPHEIAEVGLRFIGRDNSGIIHGADAKLRIPPLQRVTALLSDLFPDLFPPRDSQVACPAVVTIGTGTVKTESDVPVAVETLEVNLRNGHFVNLIGSPRRPSVARNDE